MSQDTSEPGTARWHLVKAATWLAAAQVVADIAGASKDPDHVQRWLALCAMAQAHATLGGAINADPTINCIRTDR